MEKSYAEADLQLAQARLAQAQSENQTVRGSVPRAVINSLEAGVQVTRDRLKLLESDSTADPYAPQIKGAEDAIVALETTHAESLKANKFQAGTVPDVQLQREQAEIALAKARLSVLKVLNQQPPEVRVQWELAELQDQIRSLWARPLIEE